MIKVEISEKARVDYSGENGALASFDWAVKQFGLPSGRKDSRWCFLEHRTFMFAREEDAVFFALRWL
jgi:hypothetical protein